MKSGANSFWNSGSVPLIEPEFLSSILRAASDIALVVAEDGTVLSVVCSDQSDGFGDLSHWEGSPLVDFLSVDSVEKFRKAHSLHLSGETTIKPVEINHEDRRQFQFPVRYTFHNFGNDNTLLMLGRDLRPIAETQQQLVQTQIALEQGYEARREFDSRYRIMLSKTQEAVLFVALQDGRIADCSDAAASLLGVKRDAASGTALSQLLSERSSAELMESLLNASLAEGGGRVEVKTDRTNHRVAIVPTVFRAGGQRILHCSLRGASDVPQTPDTEIERATLLYRSAADAIIFADMTGVILSANDSFLDLIGAAHSGDVHGKSLGDYLVRGQIDLSVLMENAQRTGHMRAFSTKIESELGARLSVEISATRLEENTGPIVAFVMRDMSRVEGVRTGDAGLTVEENNRNVMELVGSASLKDIVAETTDVVEKMCIETAVKLTKNNRVAAAEMLGLSRQSLYVKLRKFGLLRKD